MMSNRRYLTKEEKRLLSAHAERYSAMYEYIGNVSTDELHRLLVTCRACTTSNCWWAEYHAAQYLIDQIRNELSWRGWVETDKIETADPIAHREARLADDGCLTLSQIQQPNGETK